MAFWKTNCQHGYDKDGNRQRLEDRTHAPRSGWYRPALQFGSVAQLCPDDHLKFSSNSSTLSHLSANKMPGVRATEAVQLPGSVAAPGARVTDRLTLLRSAEPVLTPPQLPAPPPPLTTKVKQRRNP